MATPQKSGTLIYDNSSTPGTASSPQAYIDKVRRDTENTVITMVLIPGSINSVLFVEASLDGVTWNQVEDQDGTVIYTDRSSITADRWWVVKADVMPAYNIRLASYTDTGGTAGSAISGTIQWMGFR